MTIKRLFLQLKIENSKKKNVMNILREFLNKQNI